MKEYSIRSDIDFDVPAGADGLTIIHEWGDIVVTHATVSTTYTFNADSIGIYKFQWKTGANIILTEFYSFILPLISASDFFDENEALEAFEDDFKSVERSIRHTIQNYTGQKFGPYVNKTMEIQGDGGNSLYLPLPMLSLSAVQNNYGDSIIDRVEVSPNGTQFLQIGSRFRSSYYYEPKRDVTWNSFEIFGDKFIFTLTGDWGYEYVPPEVTEAAKLLLKSFLGDSDLADMRRNGINRAKLGDFELWLNADQWGSTGNAGADNLLAAYVQMGIGLV